MIFLRHIQRDSERFYWKHCHFCEITVVAVVSYTDAPSSSYVIITPSIGVWALNHSAQGLSPSLSVINSPMQIRRKASLVINQREVLQRILCAAIYSRIVTPVALVVRPILHQYVRWNTFWHWCNIQTDVRNIGLTCVTYYSSMLPIWLLVWY